MAWDEENDTTIYKVVVNHEEQYSIWPADRENPLGWRDVGKSGPKAECLAYIGEVWTDMRPLSLRKHMEEMARQPAPPEPPPSTQDDRRRHPLSNAWRRGVIPLLLGYARTRMSKLYKRASIEGMCTSSLPPRKAGRSLASGLIPRHAISVGPILKPRPVPCTWRAA